MWHDVLQGLNPKLDIKLNELIRYNMVINRIKLCKLISTHLDFNLTRTGHNDTTRLTPLIKIGSRGIIFCTFFFLWLG